MNKNLIYSIYAPPMKKHSDNILDIYQGSSTKVFYSLARHALKEGLIGLNLNKNTKVLVPAFICRDVLAPFNEMGCEIIFYNVDRLLNSSSSIDELPQADAILMVHFFGLEANVDFYVNYCKKWGAKLIEDNAHGFLSRSKTGQLLGTYGDIGVISIRKTLPIENGALLLSGHKLNAPVLAFTNKESFRLKVKELCRPIVKLFGFSLLNNITNIKRALRKLITGDIVPVSTYEDELRIPSDKNPYDVNEYFHKMDYFRESKRRRELYNLVAELLKNSDAVAVRNLAQNEVPYVFPFYCSEEQFPAVAKLLVSNGLEAIKWPALPEHVIKNAHPDFYEQLYMVKFLW